MFVRNFFASCKVLREGDEGKLWIWSLVFGNVPLYFPRDYSESVLSPHLARKEIKVPFGRASEPMSRGEARASQPKPGLRSMALPKLHKN